MKTMKALGITSGGLDSTLAALVLKQQGIDILLVCFVTPFFTSDHAVKSSEAIGMPLKVVDITRRHLKLLKNPPHGFGSGMNPCIDCHALMLRTAGEMLKQEGALFVFSGEVLGQRPFSQNRPALATVAGTSGLGDLLLRPLSAKLLPVTLPEREGWVDRERLLSISGRSRKPQMELARQFGFTDFPTPAGGCLLTEEVFSRRLKDLFSLDPDPEVRKIELLKVGRQYRLDENVRLVVGRNEKDNERIRILAGPRDTLFSCSDYPGPTALVSEGCADSIKVLAAEICASYCDAPLHATVTLDEEHGSATGTRTVVAKRKEDFLPLMA